MFDGISAFFVSIANAMLFFTTMIIFFGIMAGVYYMNERERECTRKKRKEKKEKDK
jgi:hypothetical protein